MQIRESIQEKICRFFFYEKGTLNRVTITHIVGHLHNHRLNLILLKEPLI